MKKLKIILLGGTKDSTEIIQYLKNNYDTYILTTTTTEYGSKLATESGSDETIARPLLKDEIIEIINNSDFDILIDATHPFAEHITQTSISVSKICKIPYIRFERPPLNFENIDITITKEGNIIMRGEEYKRENKLSLDEINSRYNNFKEEADVILKKKEINYKNMNDKNNIINILITIVFGILYLAAIIYLIRCFIFGNYLSCIWGILILSTYFAPGLRERFDRSIAFIKRKLKK